MTEFAWKSRIRTSPDPLCTLQMAINTQSIRRSPESSHWAVVRRPEPELLHEASLGDVVALRRLFAHCRTDWYWYAAKHCRTCLVEESIQDTLAAVSNGGHLAPRIAGIARCLWLLARYASWCLCAPFQTGRRHRSRQALERISALSGEALHAEILLAMESLPAPALEILLHRDFDGQTIAELAGTLGVSPHQARRRLHAARESMREYLTLTALSTRSGPDGPMQPKNPISDVRGNL